MLRKLTFDLIAWHLRHTDMINCLSLDYPAEKTLRDCCFSNLYPSPWFYPEYWNKRDIMVFPEALFHCVELDVSPPEPCHCHKKKLSPWQQDVDPPYILTGHVVDGKIIVANLPPDVCQSFSTWGTHLTSQRRATPRRIQCSGGSEVFSSTAAM